MEAERSKKVIGWIVEEGHRFDIRERRPGAHQEYLGEVYTEVHRALSLNPEIRNQEAFVRAVAYRGFHRACGRERKQAARHTPSGDKSVLESGIGLGVRGALSSRSPVDELIDKELCRILSDHAELLSASPKKRQRSLTDAVPAGLTVARKQGISIRTLQRRRERLRKSLRRRLEG